jgi:hypothetical protein
MDAETYGHHIRGWEREFLAATYDLIGQQRKGRRERSATAVEMVWPSDLIGRFPDGPVIEPYASSWSTTRDDIAAMNPYPLWQSPGNPVHALQWEYVEHCIALLAIAERYADGEAATALVAAAKERFEPALHSCQFWWASRRPMWDVPMVYRGLQLLTETLLFAMKATQAGGASERVKREAGWRLAAANEARARLERYLFVEEPA